MRVGVARERTYREGMARVGGRNLAISWIAGLMCAGIVAGLVWFALPIVPTMAQFVGEGMRSILP